MRTIPSLLLALALGNPLLGLALTLEGRAQSPPVDEPLTLAIVGGRLIDGYGGPPLEDSVILIAGSRVAAIGQVGQLAVPEGVPVVSSEGMTVLPGLIDLHVHFTILGHNDYDYWFPAYKDRMRTLVMPLAAKLMLNAGVTTVRDLGMTLEDSLWLRDQINSGKIPGPRTYIVGPFLRKSTEGSPTKEDIWVVKDPADAREKVRQLVEAGVDAIKTQDEKFSVEELRAIYDEAHKHDKRVATHLFTQPAIRRALQAGIGPFDTLEHLGDGPEPEFAPDIVQGLVESEVGVVPTEFAIDGFRQLVLFPESRDHPAFRNSFPNQELWQDIRRSYDKFQDHPLFHDSLYERAGRVTKLRQLKRAGARFYLGTDSGTRGNPHHAAAWREMVQFVEFGLTLGWIYYGEIYAWHLPTATLRKYDNSGKLVFPNLSPGGSVKVVPLDIYVTPDRQLYVKTGATLAVYSATGTFQGEFKAPFSQSFVVAPDGAVYLVAQHPDQKTPHVLHRFRDGREEFSFGELYYFDSNKLARDLLNEAGNVTLARDGIFYLPRHKYEIRHYSFEGNQTLTVFPPPTFQIRHPNVIRDGNSVEIQPSDVIWKLHSLPGDLCAVWGATLKEFDLQT